MSNNISEGLAVAVAQFAPGDDVQANLASIRDLATTAASRGATLIVFPEYSSHFTRELGPQTVAGAEKLDGRFGSGLAAIAKVLGVHIIAGMLESADGDKAFNTLIAVSPAGERVAVYRKLHLYDAFGQKESDWIVPGPLDEPQTFELGGLTVGLQTCYDLRFPEVTRRLADAGVQLVACPSEWVRGPLKEHHWRTLVTARAIENTLYMVAPDHAPPVGAGNSMVVDPMGVEIATIGEITDIAVAWVSRGRVDEARRINPALGLRRFGVVPR